MCRGQAPRPPAIPPCLPFFRPGACFSRAAGFPRPDAARAPGAAARPADEDALFRFDDSGSIPFGQATRGALVSASTDSGKTASAMAPMIERLIAGDHFGLINDVKSTQADTVHHIAARHGRLDDIVEIGSEPTACTFNLLGNMRIPGIASFFRLMVTNGREHDDSMGCGPRGARIAADVAQVLRFIAAPDPDVAIRGAVAPTLKDVFAALSDLNLASMIWPFYPFLVKKLKKSTVTHARSSRDWPLSGRERRASSMFSGFLTRRSPSTSPRRYPGIRSTSWKPVRVSASFPASSTESPASPAADAPRHRRDRVQTAQDPPRALQHALR